MIWYGTIIENKSYMLNTQFQLCHVSFSMLADGKIQPLISLLVIYGIC